MDLHAKRPRLRELALFAGAGGGLWATKWLLGFKTVCYVEIDEYCQRVLQARIKEGHFDDAPIWDDIRTFDGRPWRGRVDIITAGFPCQPFSVAGKQQGSGDPRNLWPETFRVLCEVRPRAALLENVPGLLSGVHGYFGRILGDLVEAGFNAEWCVLGASAVGAPHRRRYRLWVLAYPNSLRELQPEGREPYKRRRIGNCSWWAAEPTVDRVAYGVANGVNRIRALANGQIPAMVARAWRLLTKGF